MKWSLDDGMNARGDLNTTNLEVPDSKEQLLMRRLQA